MVMEVVHEDMGEGNVQCTNHPYKNSSPGGICALCLQEKLGKLVSSSFSVSVFPSSSSSSSPSLRSEFGGSTTSTAVSAASAAAGGSTLQVSNSQSGGNDGCSNYNGYQARRLKKLPFVSTHKKNKSKNKNKDGVVMKGSDSSTSIVFKRSKSTTTPSRGTMQYLDQNYSEDYNSNTSSSHTRGSFWSFLYLSKHSTTSTSTTTKKSEKDLSFTPATPSTVVGSSSVNGVGGPTNGNGSSPDDEASFDRKVSRSRSVGCGSRSFSGDFFERISTGFGDCTLRRVESQREGKNKMHRNVGGMNGHDCIKERVRCGGIFSGFMITPSSSYLVDTNNHSNVNGKSISATHHHHLSHGRSKSWGWAFASPMRAFSKPSTAKRDNKNATPNLAAIPSLLAVSS